jgi:hypothetical protein
MKTTGVIVMMCIFSTISICRLAAEAATTQAKAANSSRPGTVIDLGQLEVEGEVRRPQLAWIDSQRHLKDLLPGFHRSEFGAFEAELTRPMTRADLAKAEKAELEASKGEKHARP